ncbi:MAG: NAD(P)H-hydrate dehydratase [Bacteroidia bacterium]|nr:NAD(P)H-hydrate dehydratase [Bacteroidia bacterium]
MHLLTAKQIKAWDAFTIMHEPISAANLVERAAMFFTNAFERYIDEVLQVKKEVPIFIFCGTGNNGADGLAVARMLCNEGRVITVLCLNGNKTEENKINFKRLKERKEIILIEINNAREFPVMPTDCIIIDALFGSGLNRPLNDIAATLVSYLNAHKGLKIAIDIPSGLMADIDTFEGLTTEEIFKAQRTFTFGLYKQSFMFAETYPYVGDVEVLPIGLHTAYLDEVTGNQFLTDETWVQQNIKTPNRFAHKGTKGHVLLIGGSYGKMGAALLASKAALRAGCGMVTAFIPKVGYTIFQTALPEVMVQTNEAVCELRDFTITGNFDAIGVGPGMGTHPSTVLAFGKWLNQIKTLLLIDADGLNACAALLKINDQFKFPEGTILTPHPKEFERLAGKCKDSLERLNRQKEFAKRHKVIVVLKGAHSSIAMPDGKVYFNITGNTLLATAGSGDVLCGIITSLLAQQYKPDIAALLGVYLHGVLADKLKKKGIKNCIAGDIIEELKLI